MAMTSAIHVAGSPPTAGPTPRLLVAMDKFKGTLTSHQAAEALTRGMVRSDFLSNVTIVPLADGGDGTVDAAVSAGYERIPFTVTGPTGIPLKAEVALRDHTAVVEVADICGLRRLPGNTAAPYHGSSAGVGELLLGLADQGVSSVVLGLGGSATTDGGTGMLSALGVRFLDKEGIPIRPEGGELVGLASIDWDRVDLRVVLLDIAVACDVESPLLARRAQPTCSVRKRRRPQHGRDPGGRPCKNLARVAEAFPPPARTAPVQLLAAEAGAAGALDSVPGS